MIPGFPEPENNQCKGEKTVTLTEDERNMVAFIADYLNWEDFHQIYYEYNEIENESSPEMDAGMALWDGVVIKICSK